LAFPNRCWILIRTLTTIINPVLTEGRRKELEKQVSLTPGPIDPVLGGGEDVFATERISSYVRRTGSGV